MDNNKKNVEQQIAEQQIADRLNKENKKILNMLSVLMVGAALFWAPVVLILVKVL